MKRPPADGDDSSSSRRSRHSGDHDYSSDSKAAEMLARFFHKNGRYLVYVGIGLAILVVVVVVIDRFSNRGG